MINNNKNRSQSQSDSNGVKQNYLKEILLVILGILLIFGGISYGIRQAEAPSVETVQIDGDAETIQHITLSIDDIYNKFQIQIENDETALHTLENLDNTNPQLQLKTKSYGNLGVLVEAMGDKTNGADNMYWQYTVNGVSPMVGAGEYNLKDGDIVEWQFKQSEF